MVPCAFRNPADIPSRGLRVGDLRECQLWWRGPDFLKREERSWLTNDVRKEDVCATVAVVECSLEVRLLLSALERLRKMRFRRKERQTENMILSAVQKAGLQ